MAYSQPTLRIEGLEQVWRLIRCGVCLGVCFSRQSLGKMLEKSGTDARFPSELRQIVVSGF